MGVERQLYGCRAPVIWVLRAGYVGIGCRLYGCRVPVIWV